MNALLGEILRRHARFPLPDLDDGLRLGGDAGLDSLALVRALAEVEDRLQVELPLDGFENMRELRFGDLRALVATQVAVSGGWR